jgi:mono/diheme cytochrome c family protein
MMARLARLFVLALVIGALATVVLVVWAVVSLRTDRPVTYYDTTMHFKYGSIGSEPGGSLLDPIGGVLPPYWIFANLPAICSDKLPGGPGGPGGYASFGFVYEPGRDLPIGLSRRRRLGIDQVGLNCAVCHTGTVRDGPAATPRIVLGMPSQQLDLQAFEQFVLDCTLDNRLTADNIGGRLPRLTAASGPSLFERALLRFGLIDRLKVQTLQLRNRIAPILAQMPGGAATGPNSVPRWGRGRVDTFNPYKAVQFNWSLDALPPDELIGAADFPSLWNQAPRDGLHLHWDGDNDSVDERNLSASLGAGVTPVTVDHASLKRVHDWIWTLPPPEYPYDIDRELSARGAAVYAQQCVDCHADHRFRDGVKSGARLGLVDDIDRIGTDRHRLDSYTFEFAMNQYSLYPDSPYRFTHFRKTTGYANLPLDGIWLRGPYLHNGSVPTLRELLDAPENRPQIFYRGYDVFDQARVGFVSNVPAANGQTFFRYDTTVPGNGNGGHLYGTSLSDADKRAIVEYLKTF